MSNVALSWAFQIPITGPKKSVLIALAEHADDEGGCWPSVARLVLFSGVSERTVQTSLRELEAASLVRVDRSSGRSSSRYWLAVNGAPAAGLIAAVEASKGRKSKRDHQPNGAGDVSNPAAGAPIIPPPTVQRAPVNGAPHAPDPAAGAVNGAAGAPEPLEPLKNPQEPSRRKRTRQELLPDPEREAFWVVYPRKREGPAAFVAEWTRARGIASFEVIMDGLRRYPFKPDFLPMAATWLNQKRWLTEPDTRPPNLLFSETERSKANPTGRITSEIVPY